jgi:hypothetical protein
VNLASRVQGATKQFGLPVLLTATTRALIQDVFPTRRIGRVRLVGVSDPVELYELHTETASPEWQSWRDAYETALSLFEAGQWAATCRVVHPLLAGQEGRYDIPCLNLVSLAVDCLRAPPEAFDPVMRLNGK